MIHIPNGPRPPRPSQIEGVERIVARVEPEKGRIYPGCFALFDEPGFGKTRQVLDATQHLYTQGLLTHVLVVVPGQNPLAHWFDADPAFGEIARYRWPDIPVHVVLYRPKTRSWMTEGPPNSKRLIYIITNYEFIRTEDRVQKLLNYCGPKTMLVLDESSAVSNPQAKQTKACMKLRRGCGWVTIMNGTPDGGSGGDSKSEESKGSVGDLYAQAALMDGRILGCKNFTVFKARYAIIDPFTTKNNVLVRRIAGWRNVEDIQRRLAPYVLRRLKKDYLDLPEKLDPVTLSAPLDDNTWKKYRELRSESITWLSENLHVTSAQAGVRMLRLAQLTSGFLSGVKESILCPKCGANGELCEECGGAGVILEDRNPEWVGQDRINLVSDTLDRIFHERTDAKVILWCRFRQEIFRLLEVIKARFPAVITSGLMGGQKEDERMYTKRLLKPGTAPEGPVIVPAIPAAGRTTLDFAAGTHVIWVSHGTNLLDRIQADERVHRSGQVNNVWYGDVLMTGPNGQKTVDHALLGSLRRKDQAAGWTASAWVSMLKAEEEDGQV